MHVNLLDPALKIVTMENLLSDAECDAWIRFAEAEGFADAPVTTARGMVMQKDVRNNDRVMVDAPARASALWERVRDAVDWTREGWRAVGLNERLRFYRYGPGQCFRWHRDGCFLRSENERSFLTFLIYLNGDCEGGQTLFGTGLEVEPRPGLGLLFEHPALHQGAVVTRGRKYVLRTDVMYRRTSASQIVGAR